MARYNTPKSLDIGQKVSYGIGATIGTVIKRQGTDYQVEFEDGTRRWCGKNILQPEISPEEIALKCAEIQAGWKKSDGDSRANEVYRVKPVEIPHVSDSQISVSRTSRVF